MPLNKLSGFYGRQPTAQNTNHKSALQCFEPITQMHQNNYISSNHSKYEWISRVLLFVEQQKNTVWPSTLRNLSQIRHFQFSKIYSLLFMIINQLCIFFLLASYHQSIIPINIIAVIKYIMKIEIQIAWYLVIYASQQNPVTFLWKATNSPGNKP